jgi:hypothetical protein
MSVFDKAAVTTSGSAKPKEFTTIAGKKFATWLNRWTKLKAGTKQIEAEMSELSDTLKDVLLQNYLDQYRSKGTHPGTMRFRSDLGDTIQFIPTDRYPVLDETAAAFLNKQAGKQIAFEKTVYSFNPEILEKHIGKIGAAIDALDIPEVDKNNLLSAKKTWQIEKGCIERLPEINSDIETAFRMVSPVTMLKDA